MSEEPDHFNPHPVTKHDVLCDEIFISDAYSQNCEICKIIIRARAEGYKKGWEDCDNMSEKLSEQTYHFSKSKREMKKNIIHDDQCENSRGWEGFPCECEERS